jgi:hypothetical protein
MMYCLMDSDSLRHTFVLVEPCRSEPLGTGVKFPLVYAVETKETCISRKKSIYNICLDGGLNRGRLGVRIRFP